MDKNFIIEVATDLHIKKQVDVSKLVVLMIVFLEEKGKPADKIHLFVGKLITFPSFIYLDFFETALKYYINKYNITKLQDKHSDIITYY